MAFYSKLYMIIKEDRPEVNSDTGTSLPSNSYLDNFSALLPSKSHRAILCLAAGRRQRRSRAVGSKQALFALQVSHPSRLQGETPFRKIKKEK